MLPVGLAVDGDGARRPVQSHDHAHGRGLAGAVRAEEPGDGPGRDREAEGVHGGGVAVALGELACLDHDRDRSGGWGGTSAQQRTLRQVTVPAGGASEGWSGAGRAVMPAAVCVERLAVRLVAGDAVRRGQVQAERTMSARRITSSPMVSV